MTNHVKLVEAIDPIACRSKNVFRQYIIYGFFSETTANSIVKDTQRDKLDK